MTFTFSFVINLDENRAIRLSSGVKNGDVNISLLYKGEVQAGVTIDPDEFRELRDAMGQIDNLFYSLRSHDE